MKIVMQDGKVRTLYSDQIDLRLLGNTKIRRASHVDCREPLHWWQWTKRWRLRKIPMGTWFSDMSPVSGPVLGPFDLRTQALSAEVAWLEVHRLTIQ